MIMKDCSVDASYIPEYDVQQVCFFLCIVFFLYCHSLEHMDFLVWVGMS